MTDASPGLQHIENNEQRDEHKLKLLMEICRSSDSHYGIWGHIKNNRELLHLLQEECPDFLEVTFIEEWLASMDIFLRRIQSILQISKPSDLSIKKWSGSIDVLEDNKGRSTLVSHPHRREEPLD